MLLSAVEAGVQFLPSSKSQYDHQVRDEEEGCLSCGKHIRKSPQTNSGNVTKNQLNRKFEALQEDIHNYEDTNFGNDLEGGELATANNIF